MNGWSRFWEFLLMPHSPSLGGIGWTLISISLFVAVGGVLLVVAPALVTPPQWRTTKGRMGPHETALRGEWRVKLGASITALASGMLIALLFHLVGTPGLTMRILPALVLFGAVISVGIASIYYLVWFPRLLAECQRIDRREHDQALANKSKPKTRSAANQVKRQASSYLMPTKALIGIAIAAFAFYVPYAGVSVQEGHDHILHMLGAFFVLPFAGYMVGLALSLGEGLPDGFLLLKLRAKLPAKARTTS